MFGKLTLDAFKHNAIETQTGVGMVVITLFIIGLLFYLKRWKWIWKEWLTSLDPKKIGVMYMIIALLMLFKGAVDALMMRAQQILSVGDAHGFLTSDHFQQVFSAHGTTMIFFVGMGIVFALMNLVLPLQIGARDVAFPFLNSLGFWLFAGGAFLLNISLIIGEFSAAGWLGYPPLSSLEYSPGVGVDYWIWTLQIAGIGSVLSGVNFLVTIFRMRCPGMTFMKMPLFVWCALGTLVLVVFAFPILTATLGMLSLDRLFDMHLFTAGGGGNPMMYVNLIWAWGHPEVYILILPAFGIFSEVVATFSQKRLFGYVSMVWAIIAITFLSFIVWLHHFFTMGAGANVNAFFGIMTMLIAVPTGVKVFNWLFTMFRGRVHFTSPMLFFLGFVITFTLGGMAGVLMSVPSVDFQAHNSLFLIAHFHSMILPGVVFGFFAGFTYWFPKIFGFKLHDILGRYACICWVVGFIVAFAPLYLLGFMGATRRLDHYEASTNWQPLFVIAGIGVAIIFLGMAIQVLQVVVSIKQRHKNRDVTGDPWDGRTLEWSIPSPPPEYNFAIIPQVHERDAFWEIKHHQKPDKIVYKKPFEKGFKDIYVPQNSPMGLIIAAFATLFAFALIWHMLFFTLLALVGVIVSLIVRLSKNDLEDCITAQEVQKIEERLKCPQ